MNFNYSNNNERENEYNLWRNTTEELINVYGIKIKYLITEKVNQDTIFGEHTHIKVDNDNVFEFYAKPEETSMWEGDGDLYSKFGMQNLDIMNIFVSRTDMEKIHPEIVAREGKATVNNLPFGNLVVFDSNKIMEVTEMKLQSDTFGNNNTFDSNATKNVFKLTLKSYIANRDDYSEADELNNNDMVEYNDFGNLDSIFNSEDENKDIQEKRSESPVLEDEVIYPNEARVKAIRQKKDEENPFGDFG